MITEAPITNPEFDNVEPITPAVGGVTVDHRFTSQIDSAVAQYDAAILTQDPAMKKILLGQVYGEIQRLRKVIKTRLDARRIVSLAEAFTKEAFKTAREVRDPRKENPLYQ